MDHILTSNHALETIVQSVVPTTVLSSLMNATSDIAHYQQKLSRVIIHKADCNHFLDWPIHRAIVHNKQRLFADSITPKKFYLVRPVWKSFSPSHRISRKWSPERGLGKKKPNKQVIKEKRENEEKDEEGWRRMCEKRRTMEGATENGMMLCGPRVATHLSFFIRVNYLRSKMMP